MVTLVFPAGGEAAERYLEWAARRGEPVLAAASDPLDSKHLCGAPFVLLPGIHDPDFEGAFLDLARERKIQAVYAPAVSVHQRLSRMRDARADAPPLVNPMPLDEALETIEKAGREAQSDLEFCRALMDGPGRTLPAMADLRAVRLVAGRTFGQSEAAKLLALACLIADLPPGDVVEVGALMGQSASALALACHRHRQGPLLVVDPWDNRQCVQEDSPESIRDMTKGWNFDAIAEACAVNLSLTPHPPTVIWRMTSVEGAALYAAARNGEGAIAPVGIDGDAVTLKGRISLIHIDGNHDHDKVAEDFRQWGPHIRDDGWAVLDDYVWRHGDGPRAVGDRILQTNANNVKTAFVLGKALFIQFSTPPAII